MPKYQFRHAFIAGVVLVSMLCQGTWALAGTTGGLSGTVFEAGTTTPIANATVRVSSPSQSASTQTDASGHFVFLSLAPDSYTVSAEKQGYDEVARQGINIISDQTQTLTLTTKKSLKEIGRVTSRSATDLVKPGTTSDVYSVNAATADKVQSLGGGGGLNNAYSAIATVPGAYVPTGQVGWYQSVYIRGGDYDQVGYEYDGVPVNRAFDNYAAHTAANLGQQELQVYTGGTPAGASASGIAGFINQVIRTGTYPGFANIDAQIGAPTYYHKLGFEVGGATPNRNFSYFVGVNGYNQDYRGYDQFNGGTVYPGFATPVNTPGFTLGNVVTSPGLPCSGGSSGFTTNADGTVTAPGNPAQSQHIFADPGCFTFAPGSVNFPASISDREAVVNLHFGLPHRRDSGKDDIQLLYSASSLYTHYYSSQNDLGPANIAAFNGGPVNWQDGVSFGPNVQFGAPAAGLRAVPYYYPSSPTNRLANVGVPKNGIPIAGTCAGANPCSFLPPDTRDANQNNSAIMKVQYQKNIGSNAYLRLFGYSFYSDWLINGPNSAFQCCLGASPDYELLTHTRGAELQFADQLNAKNLINATFNYTTAGVVRYNNLEMYNSLGTRSTNLASIDAAGTPSCFNYKSGDLAACNSGRTQGTYGDPDRSAYCGANPCVTPAGASFIVTQPGPRGTFNTVKPVFTSLALTDQFKPSDKLLLNLGVRLEQFRYNLSDTHAFGQDFWFKAGQRELCYDPSNLQPDIGTYTTPGDTCPVNAATGTQEVHPDGVQGRLLSNSYPDNVTTNVFSPRISGTYTLNPDSVLRFSYGRYSEPISSAFTQYNRKDPNLAKFIFNTFWKFGFTSPRHDVRPEVSENFDLSYERHIKGTDLSFKATPFLRLSRDQVQQFYLDPITSFVTGLNVGRQTSYGLEFQLTKGDFNRNGIAGLLSYTYTNAKIKYTNFSGTKRNVIDLVNDQISQYNALTKSGPCYNPSTGGAEACSTNPADVVNPYFGKPAQPLFDREGSYYPFDLFPSIPGAGTSSYYVPHVVTAVLQYKKDRFSITPSLQYNAGNPYGTPLNIQGINPSTCAQNSATAGLVEPGLNPQQADYTSCGAVVIPNPENGGRFDNFGQYRAPSSVLLNAQLSYELSNKVRASLVLANIYHRCFGGSSTPFTAAAPAGSQVCGYGGNLAAPYVSNFYNGLGPADQYANGAGATLNPYTAHPYVANSFNQPFAAYLQFNIKI